MRIYVRYEQDGRIVSVLKAAVVHESVSEPFGDLEEGQGVIELEPTPELEQLECHDVHEQFEVDVAAKQLRRKRA